jgi:hypothetical protein
MKTTSDGSKYDDFTIRIRFRIPANTLSIDESEVVAGTSSNGCPIKLKSADLESPISDSEWLILVSEGWKSEEEAAQKSVPLLDSLCRSLSFHNLSADFGRRTPGGFFFRGFLDQVQKTTGQKVLNDERGIMIFATSQKPLVARAGDIALHISVSKEQWASTFQKAMNLCETFTVRESMAFDLFTMAHKVQESADARFVLLFSALETLLEPAKRPARVQELVDKLIEETKKADISEGEIDSLTGTLSWMRSYSIRASGRQFVQRRLGHSEFGGVPAETLFLNCYELRNRLLHGQKPHPDWKAVSAIAAPLEQMVSRLLSGKLVDGGALCEEVR